MCRCDPHTEAAAALPAVPGRVVRSDAAFALVRRAPASDRGQEERDERDSSEQEQADQSPLTARGSVFGSLAPHGQCVRRGR